MLSLYPCPTCEDRHLQISELPSCASAPCTIVMYAPKVFFLEEEKMKRLELNEYAKPMVESEAADHNEFGGEKMDVA